MARGKKTDAKHAEMEERRQQVYNLRRNGASFRDIARKLNCDPMTAHSDFQAVMQRVIEENNSTAQEHRELDLARIDRLIQSLAPLLYPPVPEGQPAKPPSLLAVDRYLRALDHRAKLLGEYAPLKVKQEDWRTQAIEDIKAGRIDYKTLSAAFDDNLAMQLFAAAGKPVMVLPDDGTP